MNKYKVSINKKYEKTIQNGSQMMKKETQVIIKGENGNSKNKLSLQRILHSILGTYFGDK